MSEILIESKDVILTFTEYDNLISGLMVDAKMYIKSGDISEGNVLLDWKSGSNVSILFSVKPIWEENKITISKAELTLSGLEDIKDSKVFKVIDKYLTDFGITRKLKESEEDNSELEYLKEIAGI